MCLREESRVDQVEEERCAVGEETEVPCSVLLLAVRK